MEKMPIYQPCTDFYNPRWDTWETMNVIYILMLFYMTAILNLKMPHDWYSPLTGNPQNADLKIGDLTVIKNQAPHATFDPKDKPSYHNMKKIGEKLLMYKTQLRKWKECLQNMCNLCNLQNITWLHFHRRKSLEGLISVLIIPNWYWTCT